MSSDLMFHAVSKRNWNEFNHGGYFDPKGSKYEEGITCLTPATLKKYLNDHFQGRRQVILLVIDRSRLISKVSFDKEKQIFVVKGKINMDAILDKIFVKPNEEGIFDISITED